MLHKHQKRSDMKSKEAWGHFYRAVYAYNQAMVRESIKDISFIAHTSFHGQFPAPSSCNNRLFSADRNLPALAVESEDTSQALETLFIFQSP